MDTSKEPGIPLSEAQNPFITKVINRPPPWAVFLFPNMKSGNPENAFLETIRVDKKENATYTVRMDVNIVFDSHEGKALLSALKMQNIAYVTARALTSTAQESQSAVKKNLKKKFVLRNTWTERGVRIQRAEKKDWPNQTAVVGSIDDRMVIHEEGGKKKPQSRHIALPREVRNSVKELIPRKMRPKRLKLSMKVPQGGRTRGAKNGTRKNPKPFVAIPRSKKMGIYIRTGDYYIHNGQRREKFRLLYRLHDRPANIEKKEWLFKTVDAISRAKFTKYFDKYMTEAMSK